MKYKKYFIVFAVAVMIVSCSNEQHQSPLAPKVEGIIKGFVYEIGTNKPISYATISTLPETKVTQTDAYGSYTLENIKLGDYVIYAYRQGYESDSSNISLKDSININFSLLSFNEYLDYYPLDVGNYWLYKNGDSYYSYEIVRDTILASKNYRVVEERSIPSNNLIDIRYERLDEVYYLIYRYYSEFDKEFIIDSLAAKPKQKFTSNMFVYPSLNTQGHTICYSSCFNSDREMLFDKLWDVKNLRHICGTDQPEYHMAKGLGIIALYRWRFPTSLLKYARINSIEYGNKP